MRRKFIPLLIILALLLGALGCALLGRPSLQSDTVEELSLIHISEPTRPY